MKKRFLLLFLALVSAMTARAEASDPIKKINHIVVMYMENRSFDNMMYGFPGADTASGATFAKQIDAKGEEYARLALPPIKGNDALTPSSVENEPFSLDALFPRTELLPNPVHRFYQNQFQINGGLNNRFVQFAGAKAKGLVMGYHSNENSALWKYAKEYTLCDKFFMGAFGGSFLNHMWLVSAAPPVHKKARPSIIASHVDDPTRFADGLVTPDGYAVNTMLPEWPGAYNTETAPILPPQSAPTIGDRLTKKSVSWKWYSQGWKMALKDITYAWDDKPTRFSPHHQPFLYFKSCKHGSACFKKNLADREDLIKDIHEDKLPQVAFYKPGDNLSMHPGMGTVDNGDREIDEIVSTVKNSKAWADTVIILTYDENGGFWDHVAPPKGDKWGPGNRVPAVIISPFAKNGYVDHTVYDSTSILKLIEKRFALKPLGGERKLAGDLSKTLDLSR